MRSSVMRAAIRKATIGLTVSALLVAAAPAQAVNTPTNVVATNSGTGMGTNTITWDLNPACSHPAPSNCTDGTLYTGLYRKSRIPTNTSYYLLAIASYSYFNDPSGSPTRNRFVDTDLGSTGQRYTYFVANVDANWIAGNVAYSNSVDAGYIPPYDPDYVINQPTPQNNVDSGSSAAVSNVMGMIRTHLTDINFSTSGEVPAITVASGTNTTITVRDYDSPPGLHDGVTFDSPTPANVELGSGSDQPAEILDPETGKELRLWQVLRPGESKDFGDGEGTETCPSSPTNVLCADNGSVHYYNNDDAIHNANSECALPGDTTTFGCESLAQPFIGTSTASGVSYLNGLVRPEELAQGKIKHVIRVALDSERIACPSTDRFRRPARAYADCDSSPETGDVQLGSIFQLDSDVNCNGITLPSGAPAQSANQTALRIVCQALKDYGMVVLDGSGANKILFYLEDLEADARDWSTWLGSHGSCPSWSFLMRPQGSSFNCAGSSSPTQGMTWADSDWHLVAEPSTYTTWP